MKYILWLAIFLLGLPNINLLAQQNDDPVILIVNSRPIHKSEFEISYKKNRSLTDNSKESFQDFLQSYIDYQLAVEEAYSQKLDTATDFRYQRSTFRSSVAVPYMQENTGVVEACIERLKQYFRQDVEINHTLIPFDKDNILPTDTLEVYKEAMTVYSKLKKTGFVGDEYIDNTVIPSVVYDRCSLNGYLGWVTPKMLPAKIVDVVYSLSLNEISKPIRTIRGYHIVQVLGRRPAVGKLMVNHIYFAFPQIPATQEQVDSVKAVAKNLLSSPDVSFETLCEAYADAYGLKDNGCTLDPFGLDGGLPASLIGESYRIKSQGDLSDLVVTDIGVHLMRLVEKMPLPDDDQLLKEIKGLVASKDWWYYLTLEEQNALFSKYNLKVNKKVYRKIESLAEQIFPMDSAFASQVSNQDDMLFVIEDSVKVSVSRFVAYLKGQVVNHEEVDYQKAMTDFFGIKSDDPFNLSTEQLRWLFSQFAARVLYAHVYNTLEKRYPDMASKVNEFAGGLLAFEAKDKNVFRKAEVDEDGLRFFFEKNRERYVWYEPRFKGYLIRCEDEESYNLVKKITDSIKADTNLVTLIDEEFENRSLSKPKIVKGVWRNGDDADIDESSLKKKNILLIGRQISMPEEYTDVRNTLTADYQDYLEKEWIEGLRAKYKVEINKDVLEKIR